MIKNRFIPAIAIIFFTITILASCFKSTTVDLSSDLEITRELSFKSDVIPLLEKSCSLSGCHSANAIAPDLSTNNAFSSLTTGNYLDLNVPENSELYGFVSGKLSPAMPISGSDPEIAAIMLAWIKQGAQNN